MKKNKKMVATLLVFALTLLASIGGMNVFAQDSDEVTAALDDTAAVTAKVVSGCDLSADKLSTVKVKQYGFSMQVPEGTVISLESNASVFNQSDYSRSYFMEQGCILYTFTPNQNYCAVSVFVTDLDSIYSYYGDYARLTEEKKAELIAAAGSDDNTSSEFVSINGQTYLQTTMSDNDASTGNQYVQYQFTTVIGGQRYVIYIQTANANDADKAVINTMIQSIQLKGFSALNALDIVPIVVCAVLAAAVAFIYFFFYRANQFVKAGITDYPRLGFDMPEKGIDEDDIYDEDDEDDIDDFEDDEDGDDEAVSPDDDEKIIND